MGSSLLFLCLPAKCLGPASELPHWSHWEQVRRQKGDTYSYPMIGLFSSFTLLTQFSYCEISLQGQPPKMALTVLPFPFFPLPRAQPALPWASFALPWKQHFHCSHLLLGSASAVSTGNAPQGLLPTEHRIRLGHKIWENNDEIRWRKFLISY